jgi:excisionase family DNA binding protein
MTDQSPFDKDELITITQAAERYGFSAVHLRQMAQRGKLVARKVGSIWLTTPADVEEYIRRRKRTGRYRDDIQVGP